MKREKNADEKFEWDMTAVILLALAILFLLVLAIAFGTIGHTT